MLLIATMGTVDTGAVDPFLELSILCSQYNMWFHVDAAFGGAYLMCEDVMENCKGGCLKC